MKLAVLVPSRGILVGPMREALDRACRGISYLSFYSHKEPIPDCFNTLTQRALDWGADLFWYVEEDVCVPPNAFQLLLDLDSDIAAINYGTHKVHPETGKPWLSSRGDLHGNLMWVSLGCTMVRRRVFESLPRPWFRIDQDIAGRVKADDSIVYELVQRDWEYGGQDSTFCFRATQMGFTLRDVEGILCDHLPSPRPGEEVEAA